MGVRESLPLFPAIEIAFRLFFSNLTTEFLTMRLSCLSDFGRPLPSVAFQPIFFKAASVILSLLF